jgi:hypothetical protein
LTADAVNAVNTINIAGNAVTVPSSAYTAGSIAVSTTFVAVQTTSFSVQEGVPVIIWANFFADAPCRPTLAIRRNGAIIYQTNTFYALGAFTGTLTWPSSLLITDVASVSGSQVYEFLIKTESGFNFNAVMRSLVVLGAKR